MFKFSAVCFFGGSDTPVVSLASAGDVLATEIDPADATAGIRLENDGDIAYTEDGSVWTVFGQWVVPTSAAGAAYEARASLVSGTLSSGATGTWLDLSVTREWLVTRTVVGTKACTITLEVRLASSSVLDSKNVTVTATVNP